MHTDEGLRRVIENWFSAVASGDQTWLDKHMSDDPDMRLVGTDPKEKLKGRAAHEFMKREAGALKDQIKIKVRDCEAYSDGDFGWGMATPEIELLPEHRKVTPRWSGVFHRENGDWRLVQVHSSMGVENTDAFGEQFSKLMH